jgi:heme-degrading monooxygenase HmoA
MTRHHLAQINVGMLKAPIDDPRTAGFTDNLDRINALAEAQPGFVWRLTGEGNNATDLRPFDDPELLVNLSVWTDLQALAAFVYRSAHRDVMRGRAQWFESMALYMCLWWVPEGHVPTPAEGMARLDLLRLKGPTADAFTFREPFPAPETAEAPAPVLDECA